MRKELALIAELKYAHYFLTVHDIVHYARSQNILCQGRGSAANSAVCYVLGITSVDPTKVDLLFERFISKERLEPPDIDVDFEHSRREEVMQYVYRRYGRHRAAIIATVIHYRPRSAIRDVGKALGLTEDVTAALADTVWGSWGKGLNEMQVRQAGLDPQNAMIELAVALATELIEFPRHLSQHVGGYVLTQDRLDTYVPIGNAAMDDRTFIEWDKDDVDALHMMKVDVLALGMLTCIRKCFDLIADHKGERYELADIKSKDDDEVYQMLQRGESLGVFQVESRAQMNMLPRLKPRTFYDLVIEVAIVRPGPIQGDMVHPYLKRRNMRPRRYRIRRRRPSRAATRMNCTTCCTRRSAFPVPGTGDAHRDRGGRIYVRGSQRIAPRDGDVPQCRHHRQVRRQDDRQHDRARLRSRIRQKLFRADQGFWLLRFSGKPCREFCAARLCLVMAQALSSRRVLLRALNSQPMGFYAPAQIVGDARKNGVEVREVDVSYSFAQNTLEEGEREILRRAARVSPDRRVSNGLDQDEEGLKQTPIVIPGRRDRAMRTRSESEILRCAIAHPEFDAVASPRNDEWRSEDWADRIIAARNRRPFTSLEEFARDTALPKRALILLADADAFRSLGLDRRAALWAVRRLPDDVPLPLFEAAAAREQPDENAKPLPDDAAAGAGGRRLPDHPAVAEGPSDGVFARDVCKRARRACEDVIAHRNDRRHVRCAGVVLVRQRPGSAKGVVFMTLEDETGIANIVVWPEVMEKYRKEVMGARLILVEGYIQSSPEEVTHLVAQRLFDRSHDLIGLANDALARKHPVPAGPR